MIKIVPITETIKAIIYAFNASQNDARAMISYHEDYGDVWQVENFPEFEALKNELETFIIEVENIDDETI